MSAFTVCDCCKKDLQTIKQLGQHIKDCIVLAPPHRARDKFHAQSELLVLLDQRYKELSLGDGKPYRVPVWNATDLARIDRAVALHAQANIHDPFAAGRMRLHLTRALDSSGEVLRAASGTIAARHVL